MEGIFSLSKLVNGVVETATWSDECIDLGADSEPLFGLVHDGDEFFFFELTEPLFGPVHDGGDFFFDVMDRLRRPSPRRFVSYTKNISDRSKKTNFSIEIARGNITPLFFANDGNRRWLIFLQFSFRHGDMT